MRTILVILLLSCQAFATSLSIPSTAATVTVPSSSPFTALQQIRIEFRLHTWTFTASREVLSLGPMRAYFTSNYGGIYPEQLCFQNSSGDNMSSYGNVACVSILDREDIVVRIQRTVSVAPAGEWRVEVWNTEGGGYGKTPCYNNSGYCPITTINGTDFSGIKRINPATSASGALAWVKWYSTVMPLGSDAPTVDGDADLGDWVFNNTVADSGPFGMDVTVTSPVYVDTPTYAPVCSITEVVLNSRGSSSLISGSYSTNGNPTLTYLWSVVSGPNTPTLTGETTSSPTISDMVYGSYVIGLTVTDSDMVSASCTNDLVATANYARSTVDANHTPAGGVLYSLDNYAPSLQTSVKEWAAQRFNYPIGSNINLATACAAAGRTCIWPVYVDQSVVTPDAEAELTALSNSLNLNYESIFLHMGIDYSIIASGGGGITGNLNLGQFDLFENPNGPGTTYTTAANGAFLLTGSTYVDVTVNAYSGASPQGITDKLLLGYALPFAMVNVKINTARVGGSVVWEYWNGSAWATLTLGTDGTSGLTQSGQVLFTPPTTWAKSTVNGSQSKYWIRITVSGASTSPVYSRVWGDEWVQIPTVFTLVGSSYTNVSTQIHYGFSATSVSDKLLIGFADVKVAEIDWIMSEAASGATLVYEYWNGASWASLSPTDYTNSLATSGMVSWAVPSSWAKSTVNGTNAYWIRVSISGTTASVSTVWSKTALRGWSSTDANRVNVGTAMEYNPTPPVGSTAKFRYQGRLNSATWLHNYWMLNPSNQQNDASSVAQLNAQRVIDYATAMGANAVMLDDATTLPHIVWPSETIYLTQSDWTGATFLQSQIDALDEMKTFIKAEMGESFMVGANSGVQAYSWHLDFSIAEMFGWGYWAANLRYNEVGDPTLLDMSSSFDAYLPENNTLGTTGLFMIWDTSWDGGIIAKDGTWHAWDRGNRGPMTVFASYLMGANENTAFIYNGRNYYYYETDQFYMRSATPATLTDPLSVDLSTNTKTIAVSNSSLLSGGSMYIADGCSTGTVAIGDQLICRVSAPDATHITTTSPIRAAYPAGTELAAILEKHQSVDLIPPLDQVWQWGVSFPAMWVDVGDPDPTGHNGGVRDTAWKIGADITGLTDSCQYAGCPNVWRRDFTKAIILQRPMYASGPSDSSDSREYDTYSDVIELGGTYYRLYADGNTGPAITTIQLRGGEGVVLMKPVGGSWSPAFLQTGVGKVTGTSRIQ